MTVESPISTEDWQTFTARLEGFTPADKRKIDLAYQMAKSAHRTQMREGGQRYFEHPRAVALILLDEVKTKDPDVVISSLLHDVAEDTALFSNFKKNKTNREWRQKVEANITGIFGSNVAEILLAVTKTEVDGVDILTKDQAAEITHQNLQNASPKAVLVKMADRLHNLRTLGACSPEKMARKTIETKEVYFPIFQKAADVYPIEYAYLKGQMREAMANLAAV